MTTRCGREGRVFCGRIRGRRLLHEPVAVLCGGGADGRSELRAAVVLVPFDRLFVVLVVGLGVLVVEEPAAVDTGEEVFEEVTERAGSGPVGVRRVPAGDRHCCPLRSGVRYRVWRGRSRQPRSRPAGRAVGRPNGAPR